MEGGDRLVVAGAVVLGVGFGGLADGIVLHQLLQWHNLISDVESTSTFQGLQQNVFWDGVFHAVTAALAAAGALLLLAGGFGFGRGRRRARSVLGLLLVGWGVFHVADQLVFHLLLDLHDIRDDAANPEVYNWAWFAAGLVLVAVGWGLQRDAERPTAAHRGG